MSTAGNLSIIKARRPSSGWALSARGTQVAERYMGLAIFAEIDKEGAAPCGQPSIRANLERSFKTENLSAREHCNERNEAEEAALWNGLRVEVALVPFRSRDCHRVLKLAPRIVSLVRRRSADGIGDASR
jgi:hypothetical protein